MLSGQNQRSTWVDIVRWRAEREPGKLAFKSVEDAAREPSQLTYADLEVRARAIGGRLQRLGLSGERVLVLYPPGLEYLCAFLGCLFAGAVAVPVYPPRLNRSRQRLLKIAAAADARAAFMSESVPRSRGAFPDDADDLSGIRRLTLDEMSAADPADWVPPDLAGPGLAFLQFTSGSTSDPKGVMVTHRNLIENARLIEESFRHTPDTSLVSWLPPYHDMGLIGGILQPIYGGFTAILLPAASFLQRPFRWLDAISREQATFSGGPTFAYDLCVKSITPEERAQLDLRSWTTAFCGSEPVRADTLRRFADAFAECGFDSSAFFPCYGLAEATLFVSGKTNGGAVVASFDGAALQSNSVRTCGESDPGAKTLVSSGAVRSGAVQIVDPLSLTRCRADEVGEIWVTGANVAAGYWRRSAASVETFGSRIAGTGEGPFLRTGDLGFVCDGELYVTGRYKELVIIRGQNFYPLDIEITVSRCHEALSGGESAAFSVEQDGEERLVILHRLARSRQKSDLTEVIAAIRSAVAEEHDLEVHAVLLTSARLLPHTSSGKLQRSACREAYLANSLPIAAVWTRSTAMSASDGFAEPPGPSRSEPAAAIQSFMIGRVANHLAVLPSQISPDVPFKELGLDSVRTVAISGELEALLHRRLSPTLLWEYPTIRALALHLSSDADETAAVISPRRASRPQDIAIIGLGNRFPQADGPDEFWRVLSDGIDAIGEVPAGRWDVDAYFDPGSATRGKTYSRDGGFLDAVDRFDAAFFNIAPREAASMDPQQRLLLEVAWEALEHAGLEPDRLSGTSCGVFAGISHSDYAHAQFRDPRLLTAHSGTGNALSLAANRLSYVLGVHGPSIAIDTACSSSLVSVVLACRSLAARECDVALAGGVNVMLSPELSIVFSQAQMLSPRGRCRAFDASADGYVRGEGCGMVVLKRLEEAERDHDRILAVIRGAAINHDGRSNGLTAPSGLAQEAVIRAALADAGVAPETIGYVEAHGTGTPLGDPIEMRALVKALGGERAAGAPLVVGSVKTNIGHLEAAAGVAGLIKVVLALQHGTIPAHLHWETPSPHIDWAGSAVTIPRTRQAWPAGPRRAGVSSFGFGGTNAHVIVEGAAAPAGRAAGPERPAHLLVLSARSEAALAALAARYAARLEEPDAAAAVGDVTYTAAHGRSHFEHRVAVSGATAAELASRLRAVAAGTAAAGVRRGRAERDERRVALLFTGQGAQVAGMGRQLYETQPGFRRTLDHCAAVLAGELAQPLLEVLYGGAGAALDQTAYAQPALFAVEYALAALWREWGVTPGAVLGHSVGEYAAACVAGAFSLEAGLRLVAARGRLMQGLPAGGGMLAVTGAEGEVTPRLAGWAGRLALAAVNGPREVVVSGELAALETVRRELEAAGLRTRRLRVSHAFHSPLMEPILEAFGREAAAVAYAPLQVPLVANVTGEVVAAGTRLDADYWVRQVRAPVQFERGLAALDREGYRAFVESGPQPTLVALGARALPARGQAWVPSLRLGGADWQTLLEGLGVLYTRGLAIDWAGVDRPYARRTVALPTYPFQRQRFWFEEAAPVAPGDDVAMPRPTLHPLVGRRVSSPLNEAQFESELSIAELPLFRDHRIFGTPTLPASAFAELAAVAVRLSGKIDGPIIEDLVLQRPLQLREDEQHRIQVVVTPTEEGRVAIGMYRHEASDDTWSQIASAQASAGRTLSKDVLDAAAIRARCPIAVDVDEHYRALASLELEYGPSFRLLRELWQGDGEAFGKVELTDSEASSSYVIDPALLDSCLHVVAAAWPPLAHDGACMVPVGIERLVWNAAGRQPLWAHAKIRHEERESSRSVVADVIVIDAAQQVVGEVTGLRLKSVSRRSWLRHTKASARDGWVFDLQWQPRPAAALDETRRGHWLIFADATVGPRLATLLESKGHSITIADAGPTVDGRSSETTADPHSVFAWIDRFRGRDLRGIVHLRSLDTPRHQRSEDLMEAQSRGVSGVLALAQAWVQSERSASTPLYLITRGASGASSSPALPMHAPVWGLGRVIAREYPDAQCVLVDLDEAAPRDEAKMLCAELLAAEAEEQLAFRRGQRVVPRLVRHVAQASSSPGPGSRAEVRPVQLTVERPGILDSLVARPSREVHPAAGQVKIRVRATGLNFRDVLNALGLYPGDAGPLGAECAGTIIEIGEGVSGLQPGDDVFGISAGSFATASVADSRMVVKKSRDISFESAASMPIAFLTAIHGLEQLASIQPGERVLIHSAAGGVGVAAMQVAKRLGAEIYATASPAKAEFLRSQGVEHVMNSRTLEFADEVMRLTGGAGVDVVLNSLSGEFIEKSLSVLAPDGRFVEIGKRGVWSADAVKRFRADIRYLPFDLAELCRTSPETIEAMLHDLLERLGSGDYRPPPITTFDFPAAADAFRFMAQARQIGKVVVRQPETGRKPAIRTDRSYLITGGLGALGLSAAEWLASRGARHLVLLGRSTRPEASTAIEQLRRLGAQVEIIGADVADKPQLEHALGIVARSMPPIAGVLHLAGVLDDATLQNQTPERFARVMAPKIAGTWNLHVLTKEHPVDWFVMFSSLASLLGSPGQSNYAAANAFQDAFAHYRRAIGLPALTVNWGPVGEAGMAARHTGRSLASRGIDAVPVDSAFALLEGLLDASTPPQVVAAALDVERLIGGFGRRSILETLAGQGGGATVAKSEAKPDAFLAVLRAAPKERWRPMLLKHVREHLMQVLGSSSSDQLDPQQGFTALGLDSLMALELKTRLSASLGLQLPSTLTFEYPNLEAIADYLSRELMPDVQPAVAPAPTAFEAMQVNELQGLSEDEMASLLAEKIRASVDGAGFVQPFRN